MDQILIYHTDINESSASPDDLDVLEQAKFVSDILRNLGFAPQTRPFSVDFPDPSLSTYDASKVLEEIKTLNPKIIFNLVEVVNGSEPLAYIAPEVFELSKVPYTGCPKEAFLKVADKLSAKRRMIFHGIKTPYYVIQDHLEQALLKGRKYLLKSSTEHASQGLETTLCTSTKELQTKFLEKGPNFFAEEFIEGREFNISIIGSKDNPRVLPIAEMLFQNWANDQLKIVGYSAKWDPNCPEYNSTTRNFKFPDSDSNLLTELERICYECWNVFGLRGYARVDFRVSEKGVPYVLEINANPCISPDAGFIAAAKKAGMSYEQVIKTILEST